MKIYKMMQLEIYVLSALGSVTKLGFACLVGMQISVLDAARLWQIWDNSVRYADRLWRPDFKYSLINSIHMVFHTYFVVLTNTYLFLLQLYTYYYAYKYMFSYFRVYVNFPQK